MSYHAAALLRLLGHCLDTKHLHGFYSVFTWSAIEYVCAKACCRQILPVQYCALPSDVFIFRLKFRIYVE